MKGSLRHHKGALRLREYCGAMGGSRSGYPGTGGQIPRGCTWVLGVLEAESYCVLRRYCDGAARDTQAVTSAVSIHGSVRVDASNNDQL